MRNMLIVSEAMARAALARKESRGGHAREDFPEMDKGHFAKVNIVAAKDRRRAWRSTRCRSPTSRTRSRRSSTRRSERDDWQSKKATLRVFRGDADGGELEAYEVETYPGMVVLDAIHDIQAKQEPTLAVRWNCKAGRCGSCSAEINGKPRLMCMTRMIALRRRASRSPSRRCGRSRSSRTW